MSGPGSNVSRILANKDTELKSGEIKAQDGIDRFGNPIESSAFESNLAFFLLFFAPRQALEKINRAIVAYCERNREPLKNREALLKAALLQYKLCTPEDFREQLKPGAVIDKFIALITRPLYPKQSEDPSEVVECTKNVSECTSLHVVFFNYQHIYNPVDDAKSDSEKKAVDNNRRELHKKLRPEQPGEMFDHTIRGRDEKHCTVRTQEFGITETQYLDSATPKVWHRIPCTPHKHRTQVIAESPIVQAFRKHKIPFVAGPSGTAADCLAGITVLVPNLTYLEKQEYFNLLAAAEVAQGHHSFAEVILVLCNESLFPPLVKRLELTRKGIAAKDFWRHVDYTELYADFLSPSFKETDAFRLLVNGRYAKFFDMNPSLDNSGKLSLEIEEAYKALTPENENILQSWMFGFTTIWNKSKFIRGQRLSVNKYMQFSRYNLSKLETDLGQLTEDEMRFYTAITIQQPWEFTHYTMAGDGIFKSQEIWSTNKLQEQKLLDQKNESLPKTPLKEGEFVSNSLGDTLCNEFHFVYGRMELQHVDQPSRFGNQQFIFNARSTILFSHGAVCFFNLWTPDAASVYKELKDENGHVLRRSNGRGIFIYGVNSYDFNVLDTCFFGPDILPGIALGSIRELRRIGGEYQTRRLQDLSPKGLNATTAKLFRLEAKLPATVHLSKTPYIYKAPLLMKSAIDNGQMDVIQKLVQRGISLQEEIMPGITPLIHAFSNKSEKGLQLVKLFHAEDKRLISPKTTAAHIAAQHGNIQGLKYLMEQKFNFDVSDESQLTPVQTALINGEMETFQFLCEQGLKIDKPQMGTAAFKAVENGQAEALFYLLSQGVNPNLETKENNTLLVKAIEKGHLNCINLLLKVSPDLIHSIPKQQWPKALFLCDHPEFILQILVKLADNSDLEPIPQEHRKKSRIYAFFIEGIIEIFRKKVPLQNKDEHEQSLYEKILRIEEQITFEYIIHILPGLLKHCFKLNDELRVNFSSFSQKLRLAVIATFLHKQIPLEDFPLNDDEKIYCEKYQAVKKSESKDEPIKNLRVLSKQEPLAPQAPSNKLLLS